MGVARGRVRRRAAGLTLLEVVIMIGIMGLLATIGLPSYRTLRQRNVQAEAKAALGALYAGEQAFFTEFAAFGNHVPALAIPVENSAAVRSYVVGFTNAGCKTVIGTTIKGIINIPFANFMPSPADPTGARIQKVFPDYFRIQPGLANRPSVFGNVVLSTCYDTKAIIRPPLDTASPLVDLNVYTKSAHADSFVAAAQAAIAPAVDRVFPALNQLDVWLIDQRRQLINAQNGVNKF